MGIISKISVRKGGQSEVARIRDARVPTPSTSDAGKFVITKVDWGPEDLVGVGVIGTMKLGDPEDSFEFDEQVYQYRNDNLLQTVNKNVVAAINEIKTVSNSYLDEAPTDGVSYAREAGEWMKPDLRDYLPSLPQFSTNDIYVLKIIASTDQSGNPTWAPAWEKIKIDPNNTVGVGLVGSMLVY